MKYHISACLILLLILSCKDNPDSTTLFQLKNAEDTGISFNNNLTYTEDFNPYTYRNFYNGGGVAIGDINNDGLLDVYFTGNLVDNKLFLNKGNWEFEDITAKAQVACPNIWSSGATFVDINADGFLDIYVCKSGIPGGKNRNNELFINNGDLTFTESSKEYGLDITGLSVQSAFFDFDKDGDLDCYLLNNSIRSVGGYDLIKDQRKTPSTNGNKLLENQNGHFVDITEKANIYTSSIGFGLGITLSDFNEDNWPDLFISNDFFEKDYLYLNNQDKTFVEDLESHFSSISMGSMGADAADLNNDLLPDMMVTEMLPSTLARQKSKTTYESWDKHTLAVNRGYFHQFPRNVLQRNMGANGFMEISRFSGVDATEWSWGTLIFDFNNDGLKDIFVSNGIYKDLLDRDYLNYMAHEEKIRTLIKEEEDVITKLIDLMPSKAMPNAAFLNKGEFTFDNASATLGLDTPSFSNGSAYGDLDNDGDLDLIVNNVNMPSFIYENTTDATKHKNIKVRFKGLSPNTDAIGAKVTAYIDKTTTIMAENYPSKGFQSSVAPEVILGLGNTNTIDSLVVLWPNNQTTVVHQPKINELLVVTQPSNSATLPSFTSSAKTSTYLKLTDSLFSFKHDENNFIDFKREQLLDKMTNNEGPTLAKGDVNKDGKTDFYIGGAKNQSGALFLSNADNSYTKIDTPFNKDKNSEDTAAIFFDSDKDGDLDLYVCSGGKAFSKFDSNLHDRLYINTNGKFAKITNRLPFTSTISSSSVSAADYDKDGDIDLFVGERYNPQSYGTPGSGYLLKNKGNNTYELDQQSPLKDLGMITRATWADINQDGWPDLVVAGEWMGINVLINNKGALENKSDQFNLNHTVGMWTALQVIDIDGDGDLDIIGGNIGKNSLYKKGTSMFINDYDANGFKEQIICQKIQDKYYPILDKDELIAQLPGLKRTMLYYKDYAEADMNTIFDEKALANSLKMELDMVGTTLFLNENNTYKPIEFPYEVQYSNVYAIETMDINKDGILDIILGGNQELVKPQFGKLDASRGWLVTGKIKNNTYSFKQTSSLGITGQIRDFKIVFHKGKTILITTINNNYLSFNEIN